MCTIELKNSNPDRLIQIIQDKDIVNWIINNEKIKRQKSGWFGKKTRSDKEEYLKSINLILDKMEVWGE